MLFIGMLSSALAAVALGAPLAKCPSLAGNWTSTRDGKGDIVHIEFFENDGDSSFTVRATPWGGSVSFTLFTLTFVFYRL